MANIRTVFIITNRHFNSLTVIIATLQELGYRVLNEKYFEHILHIGITGIAEADAVLILPDANYTKFGREQQNYALELGKPIVSRFVISERYNPEAQRNNSNNLFGYKRENNYNFSDQKTEESSED